MNDRKKPRKPGGDSPKRGNTARPEKKSGKDADGTQERKHLPRPTRR